MALENVLIFPKNRSSISYVYTNHPPTVCQKGQAPGRGTQSPIEGSSVAQKHTHNTNQNHRLAKSLLPAAILNIVGYARWLIVEVEMTLRRARGILIRLRLRIHNTITIHLSFLYTLSLKIG